MTGQSRVNPIEDPVDDVVAKLIFARKDVLFIIVMIKLRIDPFPVLLDHLIEVFLNQASVLLYIVCGRAMELGVEVNLQAIVANLGFLASNALVVEKISLTITI